MIFGLFVIYSGVYMTMLYESAKIYEYNINREMGQQLRAEGINHAHEMINSTKTKAQLFFEL